MNIVFAQSTGQWQGWEPYDDYICWFSGDWPDGLSFFQSPGGFILSGLFLSHAIKLTPTGAVATLAFYTCKVMILPFQTE